MLEWNKAGRPRTRTEQPTTTTPNDDWKKSEMLLDNDPILAIARAVVQQWIDDGKPKSDLLGVMPFINVLKEHVYG